MKKSISMNCNRKKEIKSKTTISISPGKAKLAIPGRTIGLDLTVLPQTSKKDFTSTELPHPYGY